RPGAGAGRRRGHDTGRTHRHAHHRLLRRRHARATGSRGRASDRGTAHDAGGNFRGQRHAQPAGGFTMNRSVFWALVRKDLYLQRGFIIAMLAVGLGSWLLMGVGGRAFAVGGILFITANIAGAIFIASFSLLSERKEQARSFALSLPVSGRAYDLSKLVSGYLSFGIPWLLLTSVAVLGLL